MAITRVQSKTANSGAVGVTSLNLVFDSAPTAGNVLVIACATNAGNPTIDSGSGVSWVQYEKIVAANGTMLIVFVGQCFSGASATVTINAASATLIALAGAEYSGVLPAIDRIAGATSASTSPDSGAASTSAYANELWIGAIALRLANGSTFSSPTNSFAIVGQDKTSANTTGDRSVCLLEKIVSATGAAQAGATCTSGVWVAAVLTMPAAMSFAAASDVRAGVDRGDGTLGTYSPVNMIGS